MKRHVLLLTSILIFFSNMAMGKSCYLDVTDVGEFGQDVVLEMGISLVSQFFEPVKIIPPGGIGQNECLYKLTVIKGKTVRAIAISGPAVNAYGDSELKGLKGLQHALLKGIYRANPKKRVEICQSYQNILSFECDRIAQQQKEKSSMVGIWLSRDLSQDMEYYIEIKKNNKVYGCEVKDGSYRDDYEGKVVKGQLIWEAEEEESVEKFNLSMVNHQLVSVGDETDSYERVSKFHPECSD